MFERGGVRASVGLVSQQSVAPTEDEFGTVCVKRYRLMLPGER